MIYAKPPSGAFEAFHAVPRPEAFPEAFPAPQPRHPPDVAPSQSRSPAVEFRKVAMPSQVQGSDPRLWPRLSFRLDPGERLVLFGEQPEIADEVLRLIRRQSAAMAGAVCLQGRDIWLMSAGEIRQKVAFIDAGRGCEPGLSLWQVVSRALLPEGCDWGEVRDDRQRRDISGALAKTGLLGRADQDCAGLDAAGQLALLLARALALRPGILLIDAARLDPAAAPALDLLAGQEGLAVLVTAPLQPRSKDGVTGWATGWATGWLSPPEMFC